MNLIQKIFQYFENPFPWNAHLDIQRTKPNFEMQKETGEKIYTSENVQ